MNKRFSRFNKFLPIFLAGVFLLTAQLAFANEEVITTDSGAEAVAGEFIVKYKDTATFTDKQEFKEEKNLEKPRMLRDSLKKMDIEQVEVKEDIETEEAVEAKNIAETIENLENNPAVQYIEPNYVMSIQSVNDPSYTEQWSLAKIGAETIWNESTGNAGVVIAVLDTGIDYSHPDSPKNLVSGYDFINDDSNPQDDHGHGTFVAGVIAANTNNGMGIAGICQNCSIMPVKVMDSRGIGTYADVANGIVWAADNGADIINLSIGGYAYSQILQDAVTYAQSKGALIVAAGGNQGISSPLYPAAYSNVIGVSATTQNDERWSGSNYGSYIDISAPGVNIYGLALGSYRSQTGTSAAAPHVAGIAGLLMSKNQGLSPNLIAQQLFQNTIDLGPEGKDHSFGYGRVGFAKEEVVEDEEVIEEDENASEESNDEIDEGSEVEHEEDVGGKDQNDDKEYKSDDNESGNEIFFHDLAITKIEIKPTLSNTGELSEKSKNQGIDIGNPKYDGSKNRINNNNGGDENESFLPFPSSDKNGISNYNDKQKNSFYVHKNEVNDASFKLNEDQEFSIIIYLQNQGNTEEREIEVEVHINDNLVSDIHKVPLLVANQTYMMQIPWKPAISVNDEIEFKIYAEVNQVDNEIETNDNILTRSLLAKNISGLITIQYSQDVHKYLTEQALNFLKKKNADSSVYEEMKNHIEGIKQGAYNEDTIGCYAETPIDVNWRALRHFYRPTDKKGYFNGGSGNISANFVPCADEERYSNAYIWASGNDPRNMHDFQDAIQAYNEGRKEDAYQILGHILHLVEDMSLPEHTQLESHNDEPLGGFETGSGYEQYISDRYNDWVYIDQNNAVTGLSGLLYDLSKYPEKEFLSPDKERIFKYYDEVLSNFSSLEDYFDSIAMLSYYRNRFSGDLNNVNGKALGELKEMFPSLTWNPDLEIWSIEDVGYWKNSNNEDVALDDEWWETTKFDGNPDDPDWYYIENSYQAAGWDPVQPEKYKIDWASYAIIEMKKPRNQRFKTPYSGQYTLNDNQKTLAEIMAEDLIPLSVQHAAGVMDLFWRETHPQGTPALPKLPDLTPVIDDDFSFTYEEVTGWFTDDYVLFNVNLKVKNIGDAASTGGKVCFLPDGDNFFKGCAYLDDIAPGETAEVSLKDFKEEFIYGHTPNIGMLAIIDVLRESAEDQENNIYGVPHSALIEAGGIDLTNAELGGIKIDPDTDQIKFVIKGKEASEGDEVIDLNDAKSEQTKIFLQALAVPNYKHYISLDIIPDVNGINGYSGSANVPDPFERTDIAEAFLEADVAMKFNLFSANNIFDSFADWNALVKASPYWNEIASKGFNRYPNWTIAATIIPGNIDATQTGNDFFLENIELGLDAGWWMREPELDLSGLNLSPAAYNDLMQRLQTHKQHIEDAIRSRALNFTLPELNNAGLDADPRFKRLRSIYAAISAAQWYKEQVKKNPGLPYAHIVDTEDLSGFDLNHEFDWNFWDQQAYQDLGSRPCMTFSGSATCNYRGGASLQESEPEITGQLTAEQDSILDSAIDKLETVQSGDDTYLYGGTVTVSGPDLELSNISADEDRYLAGDTAGFEVQIYNAGPKDAEEVKLKVYSEAISDGGQKTTYVIGERTIAQIQSWNGVTETFSFTLPEIAGIHTVYAIADPKNLIQEMGEANNASKTYLEVFDPHPIITLTLPDIGSVVHPEDVVFEASAIDPMTGGIESDNDFVWSSDIDGQFGSGRQFTVETLSEGDHLITLAVTGPHGVSSTKSFNLYVRAKGTPLPRIKYPINEGRLSEELSYTLIGQAEDNEDGALSGASLVWSSDLDGELGIGNELTTQLSKGAHDITLTVTDSDGNENAMTIQVIVETGTPTLAIVSPETGAIITEGTEVSFEGSATDQQEGDISGRVIWSSSIDGMLNQSSSFSQLLSAGDHIVTAMIVDSDGLQASEGVSISVQNTPPETEISTPTDFAQVDFEQEVTFAGNATDFQDGDILAENLSWSSDRDGYLGTGESLGISSLSAGWHKITLTAKDSKNLEGTVAINLNIYVGIPTANILQPATNQAFKYGATVTLEATATDDQDGTLTDASLVWASDLDGVLGNGNLLTVDNLSIGTHKLRLEATDSDGWKGIAETTIKINSLQAPQTSILFPTENARFEQGNEVHFYGRATDFEDGSLSGTGIFWSSNLDGQLGTGTSISKALSLGTHQITMTAADSDGLTASSEIEIMVALAPPNVIISQPAENTVIPVGEAVTLSGSGADTLSWSSNIDGELGTGNSLSPTLSMGTHQITLVGIDGYGTEGIATTTLIVADESSLTLNEFSDGQISETFDFESGGDYFLNLAIAKDAIVDSAQVTLHAQRQADNLQTLAVQTEEVVEDFQQEGVEKEIGQGIIETENLHLPEIQMSEPVSVSGGSGEAISSEENMGIMATNYRLLDHYMTTSTNWDHPPKVTYFNTSNPVFSWFKIGNLTEPGQIKWIFYWPHGYTGECIGSIGTGYAWWAANCGYNYLNDPGQYRVEVFLKGNSSPDWTHYYTEYFFVHENPIIPPAPTIETNPKYAVYENSKVQLVLRGNDNSERCVSREFHWNDGGGWQKNTDSGYLYCGVSQVMKLTESGWDASSGLLEIGPFSEGTVVQYYGAVTDTEGSRVQTETKSFTVMDSDILGPQITNLIIAEGDGADMDGFIDETEAIKISWQATDQSGIGEMLFHLNGEGQNVEVSGDLYTVNLSSQSLGQQSYIITATDADNSPETSITSGIFEVFRKPFILNPSLDAADDGQLDWQYIGEMDEDQITSNFAKVINQYIGSNDSETDGKVLVPLRFQAEGGNKLKVRDLSVLYRITDVTPPTIIDVMLTPESPYAGGTISIGATVYDNTGIKEVTAGLGEDIVVMIGGENDSYNGALVAPTAGEHSLIIKATDLSDLELTSILPIVTQYNGAEIFVESIQFTPSSPLLAGEEVSAKITLKNTGNQPAEAEVQLSHVVTETQTVNIPARGMTSISTNFTLPEAGEYTFQVEADPNDLMAEGDETNNSFTYLYQTTDSTPLNFEDLMLPKQVGAEQVFDIKVKLGNVEDPQSLTAQWLGQSYDFAADSDGWYSLSLMAPTSLGTEPISLVATNDANLISQVQKEIKIIDATPNAFISSSDITSTNGNILALETPEFHIVIHNDGGSDVIFPVQIKLDEAQKYNGDHLIRAGQITTIMRNDWQATGGSHELSVILDPENQVQELNESDNTATYSFDVPYTLPPQLSNLQIMEDVLENQAFEIAADILGDQKIDSVVIDINGESHAMTSKNGIKYTHSDSLSVGNYPFQISAINTSGLTARMPGMLTVHQNLADLTVKTPQMTPTNLTNNDTAQLTVVVQNEGYQVAENILVQIQLDGQEFATEIVTLSPKSELTLSSIKWPATSGSHELTISIDPGNLIQESDETNNNSTLNFKVGNVNPPKIISVSAKEILYTNEDFTVAAEIEDGLPIEVNAELDGATYMMNLDTLSNKYKADLNAPSTVGEYSLKLTAENADGLTASWQRAVTVLDSSPDLAISPADVTISPRGLIENELETITALIHNYGGSDLNQVQIQLKVNNTALETKTISIQKGANISVNWEWLPAFGNNDISIILDPNNLISESSELNNEYAASLFVSDITSPSTPQLAMLGIQGEQWSEARDWKLSWPEVEESNLKSYSYQIDGGVWIDIGLKREMEIHFDQPGEHMACVMAEDQASNSSSAGCQSILLDFDAPEAPVLIGGTNGKWFSDPVRSLIWTSPLDDGSGPKTYEISINGEMTELSNQNYLQQLWEDGQYSIRISAVDALGHQSELSNEVQLLIDATSPELIEGINSSTHPTQKDWYLNTTPIFTWPEPDDLSGVQGYYYHIDQNPGTEISSRYQWIAEAHISLDENQVLQSGQWYLHLLSLDQAGNTGELTAHYGFKVDLQAPQTTVRLISGKVVYLDAYDPHSGVKQTYYAIGKTNQLKVQSKTTYEDYDWKQGSSISFSEPGNYTIYFYSEDELGNKEEVQSEIIAVTDETSSLADGGGGGLNFGESGGGYKPYEDAYYRHLEGLGDQKDQNSLQLTDLFRFLEEVLKSFEGTVWDIKASSLTFSYKEW